AALTALAGLGVMLIEPWYLASRVTQLGYGPATSAVVAAGLVGSIALGRRARSGEASRARLLWHGIAIIALVLMTVSTDTALLAVAAVLTGCSLAARAADDRALARVFADRIPALAAGLSAAWTGSAAALAVPLVAATAGNGGGVALLWIAGVEVLALAAAALRLSMRRDAVGAAPLNGEPDDRPYALLAPGSRTEPPSSC